MSDRSSREYIHLLQSEGWSYAKIGRALGRDGSLIRQVAVGKKPGTNLTGALQELSNTGQVKHPPMRRVTSQGLAKVRGRRGQDAVLPKLPQGQQLRVSKSTEQPQKIRTKKPSGQRNRLTHTPRMLPGGRELHRITVPKRASSANRKEGSRILNDVVERATSRGRRISGTVWVEFKDDQGKAQRRSVDLGGHGGYQAQRVRDAINATPGGGFAWLTNQVDNRYPEFKGGYTVVGFDIDMW